jgi:hypothetical protein
MSVPVTVKVDLGIGELIEKLDEINERRKGRKEEFFSNICDDLESVHTIVYALDNLFVDLPQRYSDRTLVDSSEMWRKWHGREQALEADLLAERPCYAAAAGGDFDTALVYTGEAIDMIHSVEPAAAIRLRAWPQGQPNA